jgi:hypothetical protein
MPSRAKPFVLAVEQLVMTVFGVEHHCQQAGAAPRGQCVKGAGGWVIFSQRRRQ